MRKKKLKNKINMFYILFTKHEKFNLKMDVKVYQRISKELKNLKNHRLLTIRPGIHLMTDQIIGILPGYDEEIETATAEEIAEGELKIAEMNQIEEEVDEELKSLK